MVLLGDEAPIAELDEFRTLIAEGQERGFLTYAAIEACLEEVDVSKEQVRELHSFLDEAGIEVVEAGGAPAKSESGSVESAPTRRPSHRPIRAHQEGGGRPDGRAVASTRCGCTCGPSAG